MVDLISGVLDYSGAIDLPQYYVKDLTVVDKFSTNEAELGVKVEIVLGRRLLNQLLTTFMPTTFICLVAISTNFFRVGNFILSDQVNSHTSKQQPSGEKNLLPFSALVFRCHRHCQRHPPPRPVRALHQRAGLHATDVLRQDDRRLADILSPDPLGGSPLPRRARQIQGRPIKKALNIHTVGCANLAPDARGIKPDAGSRNLRRTSLSGRHCMYRYEIELEEEELLPLARMDPAFALTPKERVKKKKAILSYLRILGMAGFPFFFIFFALIFFTIGFAL